MEPKSAYNYPNDFWTNQAIQAPGTLFEVYCYNDKVVKGQEAGGCEFWKIDDKGNRLEDHPFGHGDTSPKREVDTKKMDWDMNGMTMSLESNPDGSSSLRISMDALKVAATTAVGVLGVVSQMM